MGMSIWHLLLILIVVFVVFGAGKLPRVMGDMGKGIRSLRDGMKGEDELPPKIEKRATIEKQERDTTPHP